MSACTLIGRFRRRFFDSKLAERGLQLTLAAVAMQAAACSSGKDALPPPAGQDPPTTTTTTTTGGAGGTSGQGGSGGGGAPGTGGSGGSGGLGGSAGAGMGGNSGAGTGGSSGDAGIGSDASTDSTTGHDARPAVCGNGAREGDESCDGSDFGEGGTSCERVGYSAGMLLCTPTCTLDKSRCTGIEVCDDGRDNDGDDKTDCADTDCTAACADPCAKASTLSDPATVKGSTEGRAKTLDPSCKDPTGPSGSEMVYRFSAQNTGMLDVLLSSTNQLTVSVRGTCGSAATETACAPAGRRIATPIAKDQTVFIVVDGYEASAAGKFDLLVKSRAIKCGDGVRDEPEECDDGNEQPSDGCSATCQVESSEAEPNGTSAQASTAVAGTSFYGRVSPAGDVDVVKIAVPGPLSQLTVNTFDFGDGACGAGLLDSKIEVLGTDGTTVLAKDDDSGDGFCSRLVVPSLSQGTYFVRVTASSQADPPTFPYVLRMNVE